MLKADDVFAPAAFNSATFALESIPMSAHPDVTVAALLPAAGNPNRARMRTQRPSAAGPKPMAIAPFPFAGNPKPDGQRAWRGRNDFRLRWWRRRRFGHGCLVRRRTFAINDAAGEQRQADGDQNTFQ